jgi:PleD family two-component response regulator
VRARGKTKVALLGQGMGAAGELPQAHIGRPAAPDDTAHGRRRMSARKTSAHESSVTNWTSELQLLLVEGDPGVAERYKLKLEMDGYVVRVASGRAAAMAALAQILPDLVFLDVRPSVLDASEILRLIRTTKETQYLPVVVLSDDSKDELARRGLQLVGGEWVIQSPGRPRLGFG